MKRSIDEESYRTVEKCCKSDSDEKSPIIFEIQNDIQMLSYLCKYLPTLLIRPSLMGYNYQKNYKTDRYDPVYGLLYGEYHIEYKNVPIDISYQITHKDPQGTYNEVRYHEMIRLIIHTKNGTDILDSLLREAYDFNHPTYREEDVVVCKSYSHDSGWNVSSRLPKRKIDSVHLSKKTKEDLLENVDNFFSDKNDYLRFGMPYKMVIMLEGPPGCGKTSIVFAIASENNLDVAMIDFGPKMDDGEFKRAINTMPEKSILVIEDIDILLTDRSPSANIKNMISLGSILNVLDGMSRKDCMLVFLTTNYPDRLDPALVRPGRVDYRYHLGYCDSTQIQEMFKKIIPNQFEKLEEFMKQILGKKITPAALQKYLFDCRRRDVLKNIKVLYQLCEDLSQKTLYS